MNHQMIRQRHIHVSHEAMLDQQHCQRTEELIHRCDRVAPVPVQSPTGIAKQQLENARRELAAKGHKVALSPKPSLPPPPTARHASHPSDAPAIPPVCMTVPCKVPWRGSVLGIACSDDDALSSAATV